VSIEELKNEVQRLMEENAALARSQLLQVLQVELYENALAQADAIFSGMPSRKDVEEYYRRRALC
jgi:regulator of replication initiation timing